MKRIGILRGGENDYENSLQKGGEVISHITENFSDKYKIIDIFVDKEGTWHLNGVPIKPTDLIHKVDVVWNVSDPSFSKILEDLSIPTIGVSFFSSTFENSRAMLEEHAKTIQIKMPRHLILPIYQKDFDGLRERYSIKKAKEVHEKFPAPWIVKSLKQNQNIGPVRGREGSQRPSASNGIGVHIAETFSELVDAIEDVVSHGESVLVEELISGKNAFMYTVSNFRGEDVYTFPVGNFSKDEKEQLNNFAENLHRHIGVAHYLKSNFVLHPRRGIFLTSVEFHPDLKQDSHFYKVCESVGAKPQNVVEQTIENALTKNIKS